ncbi:MAG: ATP-binding cassette domain-containing protein [Crocinitomicaceae bacterium]
MLKIQNVSKRFDKKIVLDDVSTQFDAGKIHGILGPNGAGKTTLIRIINQIVEADKGGIYWNDSIIDRNFLKNVGYLPEERGLYVNMTVKNHLEFIGKLKGMSKEKIQHQIDFWLQKFQIEDWKNKRIEELSKGMAQKIQFIVSVFHNPSVLILDEPFSGFDPSNVVLIRKELRELKSEGKTILLSTHNMNSVEELCDKVVLIHQSKKVLEGTVENLKKERRNGVYAIQFKGNLMAFVNSLWTGFDFIDKKILADDRFIARVRGLNENHLKELLKAVINDVVIEGAWEELPSMEDIFMSETKLKEEVDEQ